jgi:hypothetical protein
MKKLSEGFNTSQVSVGSTATLISPDTAGRDEVTIMNLGSTVVYLGNSSAVTTATGFPLPGIPNATITMQATAPIYGIVAAGSQTVAVMSEQ